MKFDWDHPPQDFRSAVWCFPIVFYSLTVLILFIVSGGQRCAGVKRENLYDPVMIIVIELLVAAFAASLLLIKSKWFRRKVLIFPLVWILSFSLLGITHGTLSVFLKNIYYGPSSK